MRTTFALAAVIVASAITYASSANLCEAAARKESCPPSAAFFGFMGCAAALVFACLGAAYGTAKSGVGVANMGVLHHEMVMKSIIPVVMAGVLGIYGLIVAVLLASGIKADDAYMYSSYSGFSALSAGLCCGLAGLAAGIAIGIVGDAGVRANARQPKLFVGIILILIFAEALGLYGLIVALILQSNKLECDKIADSYFATATGGCVG
eukprot:TRINITY_DN329_c0_g1_i1.p1 TRINITY_DN329_c0_g1~~TRINITY_DN329_c0_g1_i1.p1  ORF type:complete len:208 (+),score=49.31 TRINITY_DN329_c0_g1_i1:63-686(+)